MAHAQSISALTVQKAREKSGVQELKTFRLQLGAGFGRLTEVMDVTPLGRIKMKSRKGYIVSLVIFAVGFALIAFIANNQGLLTP